MKKWIYALSLISLSLLTNNSLAETSGNCGGIASGSGTPEDPYVYADNCTWTLDDNGKLTISGSGVIPYFGISKYDGYSYAETEAPWGLGVTSVEMSDGITTIGADAFAGTNLTSIVVGNGVTSINRAFQFANQLESVVLPESLTAIEDYTFDSCTALTSISIPSSITSIGEGAFIRSGLTSIDIPDTVTSIANWAFADSSNLQEITLGDSVTSIGEGAFAGIPSNATVYCQEGSNKHGGQTCADVVTSSGFEGTLQLYTKDEDGNMILYDKNGDGTITSNGVTYDSVDAMMATLFPSAEPESVATPEPSSGTQTGTSDTSGLFGTAERGKRIYTVKEANEAAGRKNKLMIRYK